MNAKKCPHCEEMLQFDVVVNDYPDDSFYGHGQSEIPILYCPFCDYYELKT